MVLSQLNLTKDRRVSELIPVAMLRVRRRGQLRIGAESGEILHF